MRRLFAIVSLLMLSFSAMAEQNSENGVVFDKNVFDFGNVQRVTSKSHQRKSDLWKGKTIKSHSHRWEKFHENRTEQQENLKARQ